jgi:hypothetical protein
MKAKTVCTPTPQELQELFDLPDRSPEETQDIADLPPSIPEADLREYLSAQQQYLNAREEFRTCESNLAEMLLLGLPIDPQSRITAMLNKGKLIVFFKGELCEQST